MAYIAEIRDIIYTLRILRTTILSSNPKYDFRKHFVLTYIVTKLPDTKCTEVNELMDKLLFKLLQTDFHACSELLDRNKSLVEPTEHVIYSAFMRLFNSFEHFNSEHEKGKSTVTE